MTIKNALQKIDDELLAKLLSFTAHATNNFDAINEACEDLNLSQQEGFAFIKMITDLGINETVEITDTHGFNEYVKAIS